MVPRRLSAAVTYPRLQLSYATLTLGVLFGAGLLLLADLQLRWVVYSLLGLFCAVVLLVVHDKRTLLVNAFFFGLQIDVYLWLLYGVGGTEGFSIPLVVLIGIALFLWHAVARGVPGLAKFHMGTLALPITLYLGTSIVSILFSDERFIGMTRLFIELEWVFLYWMTLNVIESERDFERVLKLFLLVLAIQSVIYFIQRELGFTFTLSGETFATSQVPRPGGTVSTNPAGYASFIMPALLMGTALFIARTRPVHVPGLALVVLMGAVAIAVTFTRAAWVALAIGLVVVFALCMRQRLLHPAKAMFVGIAVAISITVLMALMATRLTRDYGGDSMLAGWDERFGLIQIALRMIRSHPLVGVGDGAYMIVYKEFVPDQMQQWLSVVHNEFLLRAAETGILGCVAYILVILAGFRTALRVARSSIPMLRLAAIGWTGALAALTWQMLWVPWRGFSYNAMFWIMLGLMEGALRLSRAAENTEPPDKSR